MTGWGVNDGRVLFAVTLVTSGAGDARLPLMVDLAFVVLGSAVPRVSRSSRRREVWIRDFMDQSETQFWTRTESRTAGLPHAAELVADVGGAVLSVVGVPAPGPATLRMWRARRGSSACSGRRSGTRHRRRGEVKCYLAAVDGLSTVFPLLVQ